MLKSKIVLCGLSLMCLIVFSLATLAQATHTVSGRVTLDDGSGVEGIEVFLGILDTTFEARYTCTDADGYYEFTEVPDVSLISTIGPDVDSTEICSSPYFTDGTGHPLVIQYYSGGNRPSDITNFSVADSPIDYSVARWETDGVRVLETLIVSAHRFLSDDFISGDFTRFDNRMSVVMSMAQRFEDRGRISTATKSFILDRYNDSLFVGR